jgi:hypothetical protein
LAAVRLIEGFFRAVRSAAEMLAFVAAIVLAIGLHPPHANASSGPSDHSHFGDGCVKADLQEPGSKGIGEMPLGHADCSQFFDPLVRTAVDWVPAFRTVVTPTLHAEPFRHLVFPFDPPPPRMRG